MAADQDLEFEDLDAADMAAEDDNAASAAGTGVSLEHLAHAFEAQGQAAVPRQPG